MFFISIKSKCRFTFVFAFNLAFASYSQVHQNGRLDIPIGSDNESYAAFPIDTSGVVLYRNFIGPKENLLELTRMDTVLKKIWSGYLKIPKEFSFASTKANGRKIYFFFRHYDPAKHNFYVTSVNILNGVYSSFRIENLIPFEPAEYVVTKDAFLIAGYLNYRPVILHYSIAGRKAHILPNILDEQGEITQIKPYPDGNVDVIISAKNPSRRKCLWIRQFNSAGELIKTTVLEPGEHKNLIFGRAAKTENGSQVIAGVYGRNSQYSRGIFVAEVDADGGYVIHYYNFGDLKNFFHYLKARKENRIRKRIERRKIQGKKIKFNYRFLVHEVIPYQNQFIMLGEAFFQHYANRGNYSYPDGFQYTHAVAIGFDKKAKLLWDNSFEINDVKSYQLKQFVKIIPEKDQIVLLYLFENSIRSKIIKGSEVLEGTSREEVKPAEGKRSVGGNIQNNKLEYWYGNHLFASGIQNLQSNENNNVYKVFFINKLTAGYPAENQFLLPFNDK